MRSQKSRSRSKGNRSRSMGNIVNRVFDSSGPEGKVRGTPQQIIDKYNQLARDAQLSNDPVAVENFQQHAEHYSRLLSEAQREQEARREQQEQQQRERQQQRQQQRQSEPEEKQGATEFSDPAEQPQPEIVEPAETAQPEAQSPVIDVAEEADSGLVETPESAPKPRRSRARKPKAPKAEDDGVTESDTPAPDAPEAAE